MREMSKDARGGSVMTFKEAKRELRRVGTSKATGDAYRAMWAETLAFAHGGRAETYYEWFTEYTFNDASIRIEGNRLMSDRAASWEALMEAVS
jgi:hypothetical protein